jgi:3D-(3,5/4)-trihydroxycyclohexane-1,2-dione acylhydrolase (decyclizing)
MSKTIRLTVGQAVVQFIANQYAERDGRENRFIEGIWGIFGHGNVSGLGQGIVEFADKCGLRFYRPQHEQGMVHIAAAFAKHRNRLSTFAHNINWSRALNMVTGPGGDSQPTAGIVCRATILRIAFPTLCFNKSSTRSSEMSVQ